MIVGMSTGLAGADSDNPGGFNLGSSRLLIAIGDETTALLWKRPATFVELERQFQPEKVYTSCRSSDLDTGQEFRTTAKRAQFAKLAK